MAAALVSGSGFRLSSSAVLAGVATSTPSRRSETTARRLEERSSGPPAENSIPVDPQRCRVKKPLPFSEENIAVRSGFAQVQKFP